MHHIYGRTPMPKGDFNKAEITLRHWWSPANLLHIFRTPFSQNTSRWLLLNIVLEKNKVHQKKNAKENKDAKIFYKRKYHQTQLNLIIESNKQKCYSPLSNKLANPMISTKSYWSTLQMFLRNKILLVNFVDVFE